ncbi:hypothetical protein GC173_15265 [bacterium]|nr:hypothetical protein [bacterium]
MILRIVAPGAVAAPAPGDTSLWIEPTPGLGGAWTEVRDGTEVIRFGYPARSPYRWFHILGAPEKRHHVLSLAIERIVFARRVERVEYGDPVLLPMLKRALRNYPQVTVAPLAIEVAQS